MLANVPRRPFRKMSECPSGLPGTVHGHYVDSLPPRNTEAVAQAIAGRLKVGPVKHFELEVVIERSAVEYRLEDGEAGS